MSLKYVGKEHYISLITKKLNNELNTTELRELNNWLSASSGNAELVSEFKNVWGSVASYKASTVFDVDSAYSDFINKYNIPASGTVSTPVNTAQPQGLSITRLFFAALTALALIYGGVKLSEKIAHSVSNEGLAALSLPLSPQSNATLAPNSSLHFDKKNFELSNLDGQVYLELGEEKGSQPLRLNLKDVSANANNATLNIQRFKNENSLIADISTGSVLFKVNDEKINLTEGKRLYYKEGSKEVEVLDSDAKAFEWKKGILSFDNTPLDEAFSSIEKYYGVNITITDDSNLDDIHFNAFNLKSVTLDECLEMLRASIDMKMTRRGIKEIEISEIKSK